MNNEQFKDIIISHSEVLKEVFMDELIGDEDSFYPQNGENVQEFQRSRLNDVSMKVLAMNHELNRYNISINVEGLLANDPKNNNEFSYRPQFVIKSGDLVVNFDSGRFFQKLSVSNSKEDLVNINPKYDLQKENMTPEQLSAIKSLFVMVSKEMSNVCGSENELVKGQLNKKAVANKIREMMSDSYQVDVNLVNQKQKQSQLGV
jgi:hypothetical protein